MVSIEKNILYRITRIGRNARALLSSGAMQRQPAHPVLDTNQTNQLPSLLTEGRRSSLHPCLTLPEDMPRIRHDCSQTDRNNECLECGVVVRVLTMYLNGGVFYTRGKFALGDTHPKLMILNLLVVELNAGWVCIIRNIFR